MLSSNLKYLPICYKTSRWVSPNFDRYMNYNKSLKNKYSIIISIQHFITLLPFLYKNLIKMKNIIWFIFKIFIIKITICDLLCLLYFFRITCELRKEKGRKFRFNIV